MERDFSKRTSKFYDDRDPDTLTSLNTLIKVCEGPAPKMAFFVVPTPCSNNEGPEIQLNVEGYVRIMDIPESLRQQVREAVLKK